MRFFFDDIVLSRKRKITTILNSAAARLYFKLQKIDLSALDISEYTRNYLANKLKSDVTLKSEIKKYLYVLKNSLKLCDACELPDITFMDYGGGHGMLSLLAKESGIGRVIYTDIYSVSCNDAEKIGRALNCKADLYLCGDIDDIISELSEKSIKCNIVANYDVIEHIYDIHYFFKRICYFGDDLVVFFASGANELNFKIRKAIMKQHKKSEYDNRMRTHGHKDRDSLESFYEIRKQIIKENFHNLNEEQIAMLAKSTRGMKKDDIIKNVKLFLEENIKISVINHPTNTCDPWTGNWCEHLMDVNELEKELNAYFPVVKLKPGCYGFAESNIRQWIKNALNVLIYFLPVKVSLYIAPFYCIYGTKKKFNLCIEQGGK